MLRTLARLHDSLLPSMRKCFEIVSSSNADVASNLPNNMIADTVLSLRMLSARIVKFGWKLLRYCYFNDKFTEDSLQTSSKMFPVKVEDPAIRGDIIVHTFKELNGEISYNFSENHGNETFLQNLEKEFKILNCIDNLRSNGKCFVLLSIVFSLFCNFVALLSYYMNFNLCYA